MIVVSVEWKRCSRCRCFKEKGDDFYAKTREHDGTVRQWQSRCKVCMREITRVREGLVRRGKPYRARKRPRTARQQRNARRRQHRRRVRRETAEQRATRCVLARIDARLRRDASLDYPPRSQWREGTKVAEPYRRHLSAAEILDPTPFVTWVNRRYPGITPEEIGAALGVQPRTVRALLCGEQRSVRLTFVDKAVTNIGRPDLLNDLYPLT